MRTHKQHRFRWIAVAFAAAALAAPAAWAEGGAPDDRPFARGTSGAQAPASLGPDDRALYRGSSESLAPASLSPDDRSFARSASQIEPASVPVAVVTQSTGFDWGDAAIGSAFGLALALLGAGAILIGHRRRSMLTPA
jgi:hypothetical protein